MAGVRLKFKGFGFLRRLVSRQSRRINREVGNRMPIAAQAVVSAIRIGSFFDKPTPNLQRTMKIGAAKTKGRQTELDIEWGVPYGRVLEFGPARKRRWVIKPKRGKALRFMVGGRLVFVRSVTRVWTKDQLRPHLGPTLFRLQGRIADILGKPPEVLFRKR